MAREFIEQHPQWRLIDLPDEPAPQLLRAADLATFLQGAEKGETADTIIAEGEKAQTQSH